MISIAKMILVMRIGIVMIVIIVIILVLIITNIESNYILVVINIMI